jgi:hypothetical protein
VLYRRSGTKKIRRRINMREKKILMLIIAIMLLVSNIMVYASGTYYDGNDTSIGTAFNGNIDDPVAPDELRYVKDENPNDKTLALGNGYSIKLEYNGDKTNVTWTLNSPADPDFEIRIDRINVKASNGFMSYPEGLDDGSKTLWSVPKDCKDVDVTETSIGVECIDCGEGCGYYEISHVTVVYEFTEVEKIGKLIVEKYVYGDLSNPDDEFLIRVKDFSGNTVTGGAVSQNNDKSFMLPAGEYVVVETGYDGYTPRYLTVSAIVESETTTTVAFHNSKNSIPPGKLIVEKYVYGDLSDPDDEFLIRVKDFRGNTVTGGAVSENVEKMFMLPAGEYVVVETGYDGYTPRYLTVSAIVESETTTTVAFHNSKNSIPPGKLIVEKYVYGDLSDPDDEFLIRVKDFRGNTVTGGAVSENVEKMFMLPAGEYVVVETGYDGYTPRYLTVSAIVESETTTTVAFHNSKNSIPPGKLIVEKYVYGDLSDPDDEFLIRVKDFRGNTVTGGAVSENVEKMFMLPAGEYVVEETGYDGYTPRYLTISAIVESESTTTVAFHNTKNSIPPGPGGVTVHKDFTDEESITDMAFDYRIFSDSSLTDSSIVVESNVRYGYPDVTTPLAIGTYYIGEKPYNGWMSVPVQQFEVYEEQMTHVTLTNTAIEEPHPGYLIIRKDVYGNRSDEDDVFTFRVTRKMELYTTDMPQIPMPETVYASETTEGSIALMPGTYIIEETEYGNYDPDYTTREAIIYEGQETVSEFRNEYDRKTNTKRYRMKITKEADADEYEIGDIITYTITVENTGNQTLTDIEVTDPMVGLDDMIERLPYSGDDTVEFTVEYEATEEGTIENTAYAKDDRASDVEDDETVIVRDNPPRSTPKSGLSIVKTIAGDKQDAFGIGEQVWFNLVVTNTGETDLENIEVRDPFGGYFTEYVRIIEELKEGESVTLQDAYMVIPENAVDFDNIATATTGNLSAFDNEFVDIEELEFFEAEDATPLALPAAGVSPIFLFYGLAALASGLGLTIFKKR